MPGIVGDTAWPNNIRYAQKHFWLSLLSFLIPKETDYIAVGAVADDTISMNDDVVRQWKASSWNIKESVTQPKIFFPLLKMSKEDIVPWLHGICADFGIGDVMKNISFCDSTTKLGGILFSCGKCSSCQAAITSRTHTLQPRAGVPIDTQGYHALRDLVRYHGGAGFFKIKETKQTYSYFLAVDAVKGEGTERLYAQDNPVSFDKNAMAVIYLGMGPTGIFEDDSFNELPSLLDGCVVVNKTEYSIRKLTYLLNANYTDIDVDDHVDVIAMRE